MCADALKGHDRFVVAAHARLDGDALSSLAAAGLLLKALGKQFALFTPTGVPAYLGFLPLPSIPVERIHRLPFKAGCLLALDCGTPSRLGEELGALAPDLPCINIDHHVGQGMGSVCSLVKPEACATAQVLASVIFAAGVPLDRDLAQALALGLVTDTGGFRHDNVTPEVFALASRLALAGADIYQIREALDKNETLGRFRLWSRLLGRVELKEDGRVAMCACTLQDLQETGTTAEDMEGLVDRMRDLKGVDAACLLREQDPGATRVSLRSSAGIDVNAAAASFGGGGHVKAAGGTLRVPLAEAADVVLAALRRHAFSPKAE
ncbi:MAG: DHH family phosphoesterase [Desulfovibrio sp.]|nr:DHH family phosphoesterase [Desulfovibrio sp.]